jgi:hypothetical protein
MSINLKIALILSICMRQKNGDEVPRTGKKCIGIDQVKEDIGDVIIFCHHKYHPS